MRVLAIGDLVGENGVKKLKETLPKIREQEKIDFVIVMQKIRLGEWELQLKYLMS